MEMLSLPHPRRFPAAASGLFRMSNAPETVVDTRDFITVVSGLPRSGTSLMMQMLAASGMETLTDGLRAADDDNPRGYFEFEPVKKLKHDAGWLPQARGKAVKVISQLLFDLPATHCYRIVFMRRDLDEVLASQAAMMARRATPAANQEKLRDAFSAHLQKIDAWLDQCANMTTRDVDYAALVNHPSRVAAQVNHFLGGGLDVRAMAAAVDPLLYRHRRRSPAD